LRVHFKNHIQGVGLAIVAILAAAFLFVSPSAGGVAPTGGWSFARWGMSQAAVRAASGGAAHSPPEDPDDPDDVVDGGATLDQFHFKVRLQYAASGLAQIDLRLEGRLDDCKALGAYLKATYGAGWSEEKNGDFDALTWRDATGGNTVTWSWMGDGDEVCEIELNPVPKEG
jgi:hypothetical protein